MSSDPRTRRRLHSAAEEAKRILSTKTTAYVEVPGLLDGEDFSTTVTRARFEALCDDLFQSCMTPVTNCLEAARLASEQIDEVVLVGGSTRIPKIQSLLKVAFRTHNLNQSVNPDEAVAYGAAIQAALITGNFSFTMYTNQLCRMKDMQLHDVTPLSLGIGCTGDVFSTVLPRNSPIPTKVTRTEYFTATDDQPVCGFPVFEGERAVASMNNELGSFSLKDIPLGPKGSQQFAVTFSVDGNGILTVTAKHVGTGNWKGIAIDHSSGRYSEAEVQRMIQEAKRYRQADESLLKKNRYKNDLEEYINGVKNVLKAGLRTALQPLHASALQNASEMSQAWLTNENRLRKFTEYCNKRLELEALCSSAVRNAKRAILSCDSQFSFHFCVKAISLLR